MSTRREKDGRKNEEAPGAFATDAFLVYAPDHVGRTNRVAPSQVAARKPCEKALFHKRGLFLMTLCPLRSICPRPICTEVPSYGKFRHFYVSSRSVEPIMPARGWAVNIR